MGVYLGKNKVGMVKKFKGMDRLQWKCDNMKTLYFEFAYYTGTELSPVIEGLDTSNVTNFSYAFSSLSKLTSLDLSKFNTSSATNMSYMFYSSSKLADLNVSTMNTSNVTTMSHIFDKCSTLTKLDLSSWDVRKVDSMDYMFNACSKLSELNWSNFDAEKATTMAYMFYQCTGFQILDLSKLKSSTIKSMGAMFQGCSNVTKIDLSGLQQLKAQYFQNMFDSCTQLKEVVGCIDLEKASNVTSIVNKTGNLEKITFKNIKKALTIGSGASYGANLTLDTLINTIKELWDYSSGTTKYTLTMSTASKELIANTYVKLVDVTDEMLAADPNAANKLPCVVCESTDEGAMLITSYATAKNWTIA